MADVMVDPTNDMRYDTFRDSTLLQADFCATPIFLISYSRKLCFNMAGRRAACCLLSSTLFARTTPTTTYYYLYQQRLQT